MPQAPHQWVECTVKVPNPDRGGESEIQCQAKVRCDDVVDALDLSRWTALAFMHLWHSADANPNQRDLQLALWYLKRACAGQLAEARAVARLLRMLVHTADDRGTDLRTAILQFATDAEMAEFSAISLIHDMTRES